MGMVTVMLNDKKKKTHELYKTYILEYWIKKQIDKLGHNWTTVS